MSAFPGILEHECIFTDNHRVWKGLWTALPIREGQKFGSFQTDEILRVWHQLLINEITLEQYVQKIKKWCPLATDHTRPFLVRVVTGTLEKKVEWQYAPVCR